ncbi:PREDICTED: uncharacterized protein LOC108566921 [Nicrophorus vespilloides]|uniref:Uncharacterized protein LOC108566921 n=1 Tax=Nicrophorus vespilloides TaxID=110193 RepID=A0ABM1N6U5_NICVS|nr:PREDICTED: uncharacterized protein LOC108566921 [Nicrophorus vespilloides]
MSGALGLLNLLFLLCSAQKMEFNVEYKWTHLNYTWPSQEVYDQAVKDGAYVPENNAPVGIKFYKDKLYLALIRIRSGTPITLAYIEKDAPIKFNQLLTPFPSWQMNAKYDCKTLQNVQSMEIDKNGIMWVLDGTRISSITSCPAKLVLLDLNDNGKVLHTYVFPEELALSQGGFLNDIVLDESDGGFAYITDNSNIDPGLIVYSKNQNKAWKFRDATMFPELHSTPYKVNGIEIKGRVPIDGIALSPVKNENRFVYYTPLTGYNMYAINTKILKDETNLHLGNWRKDVKFVGIKSSHTDGMIMDNKGNLFYGLLQSYGIGKWNENKTFRTAKQIYQNKNELIWPDTFAMDSSGNLFVLSNQIVRYIDTSNSLKLDKEIKFRILQTHTGNNNMLVFCILLVIARLGWCLNLSVDYEWNYINFTWPTFVEYNYASYKQNYIPENNVPTCIRIYDERLYVALGRLFPGTPVTLASMSAKSDKYNKDNPILAPFPDWDTNVKCNCSTLQNVYTFDIDRKGVMWIVDGVRNNNLTECPAKLVLYSLRSKKFILSHIFSESIAKEAFLTDIAVDVNYAYIADNSKLDPGLIIYSRSKDKSWKLRDDSMFPQQAAVNFTIDKKQVDFYSGIYGIALSPERNHYTRRLYFNSISSYNIYHISTNIIQDEYNTKNSDWRKYVDFAGKKIDQSVGLIMDPKGNLFFNLIHNRALAKWNVYQKFSTARIIMKHNYFDWCDGYSFDTNGNLVILSNEIGKYLATKPKRNTKAVHFRILRLSTKK